MPEKERHFKAVIFDMGGVIWRTEDGGPREKLAARFGLTRKELEEVVFLTPHAIEAEEGLITEEDHWQAVAADLKIPSGELAIFQEQFWAGVRLDMELMLFIKNLKPAYKTGLLSNAWGGARAALSRLYPIPEIFDAIIFSAEVGMRKPGKPIYDHMLKVLDVKAGEAVFVDDFPANILGAQAAGMSAVHFTGTRQAVDELTKILEERRLPE